MTLRPDFAARIGIIVLGFALVAAFALQNSSRANDYFELRIFDVVTNKTPAVVERFRDVVEPLRAKHGIDTVAFWTNATAGAEKFVDLLRASSREDLQQREKEFGSDPEFQKGYAKSAENHGKTVEKIATIALNGGDQTRLNFAPAENSRVFDLRIYSILPGKLAAFEERWRNHAVRIYERHGLQSIGSWTAERGTDAGDERFACLLAGESVETINAAIAKFHKDEEWLRIESETERNGKLRSEVTAWKLKPVDFSKLK